MSGSILNSQNKYHFLMLLQKNRYFLKRSIIVKSLSSNKAKRCYPMNRIFKWRHVQADIILHRLKSGLYLDNQIKPL